MQNLGKDVKVTRLLAAVAAGSTDITSATVLDMQGFDGVMFIVLFGALTTNAVTGIKLQQGQAANLSDAADLLASALAIPDTGDDKCLVSDVFRPSERYVKPIVTRSTANAVVDGIIAIQYGARTLPVTHDTTVYAAEYHATPAEGTA